MNSSLGAANDNKINRIASNRFPRITDGVRSGRTSRGNRKTWSRHSQFNGDIAGTSVRERRQGRKRVNPHRAFFHQSFVLVENIAMPGHGRSNDDASPISAVTSRIKSRILNRHLSANHSKLRGAIHAFETFDINVFGRIKILDFTGKLGGKRARIKGFDSRNARFSLAQRRPELIFPKTNG